MSLRKFAAVGLIATLGAGLACTESATAQSSRPARTDVRYGYCFPGGGGFIYAKAQATGVAECAQRCVDDPKCAAFEIWDHTFTCKLFSAIPKDTPRPQTVFPQNRKQDGSQAQAALGIKVTEGF